MAGETKQPFAVMVKPVGSRCNMRCAYCYYLEKGRFSAHARQTVMSDELLEKVIRQTIGLSEGPVVSFVWHGGEPTLAGIDFYRKALALERKYLPQGWEAWNNLQTNGLLIDRAWCRFLKANRFDIGVSLDGTEAVHDRHRRTAGGEGTHARILESIGMLRSYGLEPDLLCTVNSASAADPLGTYRALKETGCTWIQFIPIVVRQPDGILSPESVTGEAYGEFLKAVFDEWTACDLGDLDIQIFAETARILAGGDASVCWMSRSCGRVLIAEEDGAVYSCDHFVDQEHRLGELEREDLEALAGGAFQRRFGENKTATLTRACRSCPFLRFCNGGCPKDRFGRGPQGEEGQNILCDGYRGFFDHAVPVLRKIMKMSGSGLRSEEIRSQLHGPGRAGTDPGKKEERP